MNVMSERLGTEKIGALLLRLSLPATVGMMVNALYNVVDTIFIGRGVGSLAIGGLAIAFPIQMVIMSFALMVGIGAASAISRSLGAKNVEKADYVAGNAFISIAVLSLILMILGLSFTDPMLRLFGATDTLLPYARDYISVILIGSIFFSFTVASNNLVRAEGNAKVAMTTMVVGTGLNILLDPIFIFVFKLGIKGAAYATIISQFVSFIYIITYLYGGKSSLKVKLHHLKPDIRIIKEIFTVGFSAFARMVAGSLVAIVLNNSLRVYGGDAAITVLGIVNRLIMFLFMPLFGVVQGMQPIAGFNFGRGMTDRVKEVVKLSIRITVILASFSWLIGQLFPKAIMSVFTKDTGIIDMGTDVVRIVTLMVPIIGIQIVGAALYQSLGKALPSLIFSLLRQVIMFIPLVLILPGVFNLGLLGIWLAFPIADLFSTLITAFILKKEMKVIASQRTVL